MSQKRPILWRINLLTVLGATLIASFTISPPTTAQPANSPNLLQQILRRLSPPRNRNAGAPSGRQFAGARRDLCPLTIHPLTALTPSTNLGFTLNEHPVLWFYMPYAQPQAYEIEFVLIDPEENDVYKQNVPLPAEPGVISIQVPDSVPALEAEKSYRWVISVMCNPGNRSGDATVNGWIERIEQDDLESQLAAATTFEDRMLLYSENNLWYDVITTLAQLRRDEPANAEIQVLWADLLTSSGFSEGVTSAPVTSCCTVQ